MSITYEEALATLESMFGAPWTRETLDGVLRYHQGHMENTVDSILRHGSGDPAALIKQLKSGTVPQDRSVSIDEQLARQLAHDDRTAAAAKTKKAPNAPAAASTAPAPESTQTAESKRKGRGTQTELPPDFLRVPGFKGKGGGLDADEALARMLQDELFSQELANNPEFAHLASGRPRTNGGLPMSSMAARNRGRIGELPSRSTSGMQRPASANDGPNIMDRLSEMGETAKKRLQLMAAQWNANNRFGRSNAPSGTGGAAERRGLLDEEDDGQEMEMSFARVGKKTM